MWKRLSSGSCTAYERARLRMRRLIILAASAMAATVVAWGLPPSAAASICSNHRVCPLPDLVVTAAGVSFTQPYAFHNRDATASFADTTKNKGDDPADQSRTGLVFEPIHAPPHETRWGEDFRKVPKLQPGKSNSDVKSITFKADIPLGAYKVYVCADVHDKISESNERNNCKWSGEYFYVIRHRWPGSVSGIAGCCSVSKLEKWHTVGPSYLKFVRYKGKGRFRYDFSGTVHYSDHGIGSTCYYNGGDVTKDFNDAPQINLDYLRGTYGGAVPTGGTFYTITTSGPPGFPFCAGTLQGPVSTDVLRTRTGPKDVDPLNYDQTTLKGSLGSSEAEGTQWIWDFQ